MTPDDLRSAAADGSALIDLPLRTGPGGLFDPSGQSHEAKPVAEPPASEAAPLSRRWLALAADEALVCLILAAAALSASALRGGMPTVSALCWAAAFAVYLSFFATVLPLALFGRTLGMALADLTARAPGTGRIRSGEAMRRWLGTLASVATLGLPLLFTRRDPGAPSLADRISRRPLVESERDDRP